MFSMCHRPIMRKENTVLARWQYGYIVCITVGCKHINNLIVALPHFARHTVI